MPDIPYDNPSSSHDLDSNEIEQLRELMREDPTELHGESNVAGDANTASFSTTLAENKSCTIGPYKLLQRIGMGGMGEVWMADQEKPVRRRVALKLIKAGMDTKQVVARFEAERQALAMMDHQNIAKVLEARPPSTAHRLKKFVSKNRGLVRSLAAIVLLCFVATIVSTVFGIFASLANNRASKSERQAIAEKLKADESRVPAEEAAERAIKAESFAKGEADRANRSKEETEYALDRSSFFLACVR